MRRHACPFGNIFNDTVSVWATGGLLCKCRKIETSALLALHIFVK